jgi:hypothetical protein
MAPKPPPTLPPGEKAELVRQGAKAAARGEARATNPMSRDVNSPDATGESAQTWEQRSDAWQSGHDHQSQRPEDLPPLPLPATDKGKKT